jgi:hypothetical protein
MPLGHHPVTKEGQMMTHPLAQSPVHAKGKRGNEHSTREVEVSYGRTR